MISIAVCGCSFSSLSKFPEKRGNHWSEILAKKLNANLINLAIGGSSNNLIRLQIEYAKKLNPDIILIQATKPDRLEVKNLSNLKQKNYYKLENFFNSFTNSIKNIAFLTSISFSSVLNKNFYNIPITEKQKKILEEYFYEIYDYKWKEQIDQYVLASALYELKLENKNFLFNPWLLSDNFKINNELKKHFLGIDSNFNEIKKDYFFEDDKDDLGYHINNDGQKIIAEKYFNYIQNIV